PSRCLDAFERAQTCFDACEKRCRVCSCDLATKSSWGSGRAVGANERRSSRWS
ncbi:unnamed protein product, partial [Effrenium voratum]